MDFESINAAAIIANDIASQIDNAFLGKFITSAFPSGATDAQLSEINMNVLCNAVGNATSCKELKTNAALYKAIGDYIIANASGADQIAIANRIMLERNANSGGNSGNPSAGTGATSGADSAALKAEVASLKDKLDKTSKDNKALKSEINALKTELEALKKDSGNSQSIETLQKTIGLLEKSLESLTASLNQTQDTLALAETPQTITKSIKSKKGSALIILFPSSASGAKVALESAKTKNLAVSASGSIKVIKKLKKGRTYIIKTTAICGDQTKVILLKLKAK